MEPRIQYAKTSDGVNIAYWTIGHGLPIVWIEFPSHLQAEQRLFPDQARMYEAISRSGTVVRYDHRGFGLSDRAISNFPLHALVKDLEAVVDKLAMDSFILMATAGFAGPIAILYAASHPERVSKLVLGGSFARVKPAFYEQIEALLNGTDWRFISESISRLFLGWDDEEVSRALAAFWREASSLETFKDLWRDLGEWNVLGLLPNITAPTLLTTTPANPVSGLDEAREMSSLIPDAQLVISEGATYRERTAVNESAIGSFLFGPSVARHTPAERTSPQRMTAILFADIADSTAITERIGDTAFRDKARGLDEAMRAVIGANGGTAVEGKLLGDGVLSVFNSARQAIEAALACLRSGDDADLSLHLGIHAGDVIREDNNIYGGAVNIAARISGLSAPGEVLVSETVRSLARTSAGVSFKDRGEQSLKGVGETVKVWAVTADNTEE